MVLTEQATGTLPPMPPGPWPVATTDAITTALHRKSGSVAGVRVLDELPKTPTAKVEKHRLRAEGPVAGTWDREAEGIVVKGERFAPAANSAASSGSGDAE